MGNSKATAQGAFVEWLLKRAGIINHEFSLSLFVETSS
jgi:hypothetical protein